MQNTAMHTLHTPISLVKACFMAVACMCFAAAAVALAAPAAPQAAFAQGAPQLAFAQGAPYTMPETNIRAQVETDGSMQVVEQRTFAFTGANSELKWQFDVLPKYATRSISAVRVARVQEDGTLSGAWQELAPANTMVEAQTGESGAGAGSFFLDNEEDALYVYFAATVGSYVVELDYSLSEFVQVYNDAALITWAYMSSAWPAATDKFSMTITLPVPFETKVVPDVTVRAWGHGPAAGFVSTHSDGSVVYVCSHYDPGQYGTTQVLFPSDWLTNLSLQAIRLHAGARITDAVEQEQAAWFDADGWRSALSREVDFIYLVFCAGVLLVALLIFAVCGRKPQPQQTASAQGQVNQALQNMHPAVVARLFRWNQWSNDDLASYGPTGVAAHSRAATVWQEALNAEVAQAGVFDQRSFKAEKLLFACAGVLLVVTLLVWRATNGQPVPLVAGLITAAALALLGNYMPRRTQLGENIVAALADGAYAEELMGASSLWQASVGQAGDLEHGSAGQASAGQASAGQAGSEGPSSPGPASGLGPTSAGQQSGLEGSDGPR